MAAGQSDDVPAWVKHIAFPGGPGVAMRSLILFFVVFIWYTTSTEYATKPLPMGAWALLGGVFLTFELVIHRIALARAGIEATWRVKADGKLADILGKLEKEGVEIHVEEDALGWPNLRLKLPMRDPSEKPPVDSA